MLAAHVVLVLAVAVKVMAQVLVVLAELMVVVASDRHRCRQAWSRHCCRDRRVLGLACDHPCRCPEDQVAPEEEEVPEE